LAAAVAVLVWYWLAPALGGALAGLPPLASGSVLALLLALASVPVGVPFPRLLASLERPSLVAAALAMSGVAAVAAGAGATWLAHSVGAPAVAWAAGAAYSLAAVVVPRSSRTGEGHDDGGLDEPTTDVP